MSLLFMDGFDSYAQSTDLLTTGRWSAVAGSADPDYARTQGKGFRPTAGGITTVAWTPVAEAWVGFAVNFTAAVNATILTFQDSAGNEQCRLQRNAAGSLLLQRGGTVLATSAGTYSTGTWRFVEVRALPDNAAGTMELWVDGISVLSAGPTDTSSAGTPEVAKVNFGSNFDMDDVYVLSTSGAAPLNGRLGDVRVSPLEPAGPGSVTGWVSNGLTNHRSVAENDDGDYTFNQSNIIGATDLFDYQDPQVDVGSVLAIQVVTSARRGTAGTHDIASVVRSGGTNYENTQYSLGTSVSTEVDLLPVNPDTGIAWTISELRDAEFGYRLKT